MDRKTRVVQYGCGRMGTKCMNNVFDKGAEIVGAFDMNADFFGKDISVLIGGERRGVAIQDATTFKDELRKIRPDIVLVTTASLVKDVYESLIMCAENGINAITSCEEAIYPWNSAVTLTRRIDQAAKKTGATVTGSGAQEMQWCSMINNLGGSLNRIEKICGETQNNVDDYGIAFANSFGAGMSPEKFEATFGDSNNFTEEEVQRQIDEGEFIPGFMWNSNAWLAESLGLSVKKQRQRMEPHIAETDIESSTLQKVVPAGYVRGASSVVETETAEGILIKSAVKAVIYGPKDFEYNDWGFYSDQGYLKVSLPKPPTAAMTCSTIVNRIPDVINAPAGFITSNKMPPCKYLVKPMNEYIK